MQTIPSWILGLTLLLAAALRVDAVVTTVDLYHFGESDPNAMPGALGASFEVDASGNPSGAGSLQSTGSARYSADVAPGAAFHGSSLSMDFNFGGARYSTTGSPTNATDNIGVEGWYKPTTASTTQALTYTGGTSVNGFGLFIIDGKYQVLFGGLAILDSQIAAVPNEWAYFAFVRDGGTNKLFVNSATAILGAAATPAASFGGTFVGGSTEAYTGLADEVRFFTFAPGAFNAAQDLAVIPEPGAAALLGLGSCGLLLRRRRS